MVVGFRVGVLLLAASLAANIFGYVALSLVFRRGALIGAFIATAFYSTARILSLILIIALRSDRGRSLTQGHRETVERWGERILALVALLMWLRSQLYLFTIYDIVVGAITEVLQFPLGSGPEPFKLGDALSIFLILVLGFALAKFVTFVLEKSVLLRLPLQQGLPYAISKVTYYILLLMVLLAALSKGVDLSKFTVVTGAIGVGLGFGLQNIVNNFVSGLILLFERPIRVGDTVDIGGMVGTVKRIGARSSTVLTFQDAEVIVPNSNLIANQVINWTLSSSWRRVEIPVSIAYGTDPERVLKLLVEVAKSNSGVMINPEPMAFFLGFGESALTFELRFWSARQETWFQLKSDVAIAVSKALREAGIEIPFPQRDLHVRSIDASAKETLTGDIAVGGTSAQTGKSESTSLLPQDPEEA
jgi:small-conductance mechanosensitive channel